MSSAICAMLLWPGAPSISPGGAVQGVARLLALAVRERAAAPTGKDFSVSVAANENGA